MGKRAETIPPVPWILNAADRCDGCSHARAYGRATINPAKSDLNFCYHCWNRHVARLREVAVDLLDETDALTTVTKLDVSA
jgi:hypothetical protein